MICLTLGYVNQALLWQVDYMVGLGLFYPLGYQRRFVDTHKQVLQDSRTWLNLKLKSSPDRVQQAIIDYQAMLFQDIQSSRTQHQQCNLDCTLSPHSCMACIATLPCIILKPVCLIPCSSPCFQKSNSQNSCFQITFNFLTFCTSLEILLGQ